MLVGASSHPRVTWDLEADTLVLDGELCRPAALFLRHDVFTALAAGRPEPGQRAMAWFTALCGWGLAHPEVRLLNRRRGLRITNKPQTLLEARAVGLAIPRTLVCNDHALLEGESARRSLIVKPVAGGDYTRELGETLRAVPVKGGSLAAPGIVQDRLEPPEVRVYGIGGRYFAFRLEADVLDYRTTSETRIVPLELTDLPDGQLESLKALMDRLGLDFAAADFKTCPETRRLLFLEINDGPMFAAFDAVAEGRLTEAIADFLGPR